MNKTLVAILAMTGAFLAAQARAAVSAEEAKALGTTLTMVGAIKSGNAEGTIPPYTGGLTTPPPGFKPSSDFWVDPFKHETPLFRIDATNVERHADKLSEGQKHLLRKFPGYYIDIYPSHRTAALPDRILKATVRNATTCNTLQGGLAVDPACRGGIPFPISRNGNEVMWNQQLRYTGDTWVSAGSQRNWVVDSSGRVTLTAEQTTIDEHPYYQTGLADRDPQMYWRTHSVTKAPARKAGEVSGLLDFLDPVKRPRSAWNYAPGQRRVRLAPEFSYDTPVASMGGVTLFDELALFSGTMDRFDFKLVGRKEMYIPYNAYRFYFDCKPESQFLPTHVNPACQRWELHRVWVVEATLKPGKRHAYSKRIYYLDEDTYSAGMFDAFDQAGQLHRWSAIAMVQLYDQPFPYAVKSMVHDFNKGMYALFSDVLKDGYNIPTTPAAEVEMSPEAFVGQHSVR